MPDLEGRKQTPRLGSAVRAAGTGPSGAGPCAWRAARLLWPRAGPCGERPAGPEAGAEEGRGRGPQRARRGLRGAHPGLSPGARRRLPPPGPHAPGSAEAAGGDRDPRGAAEGPASDGARGPLALRMPPDSRLRGGRARLPLPGAPGPPCAPPATPSASRGGAASPSRAPTPRAPRPAPPAAPPASPPLRPRPSLPLPRPAGGGRGRGGAGVCVAATRLRALRVRPGSRAPAAVQPLRGSRALPPSLGKTPPRARHGCSQGPALGRLPRRLPVGSAGFPAGCHLALRVPRRPGLRQGAAGPQGREDAAGAAGEDHGARGPGAPGAPAAGAPRAPAAARPGAPGQGPARGAPRVHAVHLQDVLHRREAGHKRQLLPVLQVGQHDHQLCRQGTR